MILWLIESSKEQHLFEIETFSCPFDQFNAPLLNKRIHFLKKNLADQKPPNINIKTFYTVQKWFFTMFINKKCIKVVH